MASKCETVLAAVKALVAAALPRAEVKRNLAKAERVPPGGPAVEIQAHAASGGLARIALVIPMGAPSMATIPSSRPPIRAIGPKRSAARRWPRPQAAI